MRIERDASITAYYNLSRILSDDAPGYRQFMSQVFAIVGNTVG
ncbi:MAG: hypothetical protein OJF49_000518 [Ktedonobacterales bacterium]|jgi:hypothetical protein|nr:MAG: hypothetical protein OJF49_000518 [Ktedonobacterales bacterium]